jgi:hypothetical protein
MTVHCVVWARPLVSHPCECQDCAGLDTQRIVTLILFYPQLCSLTNEHVHVQQLLLLLSRSTCSGTLVDLDVLLQVIQVQDINNHYRLCNYHAKVYQARMRCWSCTGLAQLNLTIGSPFTCRRAYDVSRTTLFSRTRRNVSRRAYPGRFSRRTSRCSGKPLRFRAVSTPAEKRKEFVGFFRARRLT